MEFPSIDTEKILQEGGKFVTLEDGRIVEYSVMGSTDPNAKILVSGFIAVHRLKNHIPKAWTESWQKHNLRVIDVSIPGLGSSSFHPGAKISDWPKTDLEPVLQAEGVSGPFYVYGTSYGCLIAMAVAQHFGPERVIRFGLRCPYLPRPLSKELGLPDGQPVMPATKTLLENPIHVRMMRSMMCTMMKSCTTPGPIMSTLMKWGVMGRGMKLFMNFKNDHPEDAAFANAIHQNNILTPQGLLFMLAEDVALDCPGLDIRSIQHKEDQVIVWYADDDTDCPPSHGKWLAEHFGGNHNRVLSGYGHLGASSIDNPEFVDVLVS